MQAGDWPAPAFSFRVRFGSKQVSFAQVTGIEAAVDAPAGAVRYGNVLLSRGIFRDDFTLWRWFEASVRDPVKRQTVIIDLLDGGGKPMRRWALQGARPVRVFGPDLNAMANAVAIETIEIAYDSIVVSSGG
jgi:phage tail-like protein